MTYIKRGVMWDVWGLTTVEPW